MHICTLRNQQEGNKKLLSIFGHISFPPVNFSSELNANTFAMSKIGFNYEGLTRTVDSYSVMGERRQGNRVSDFYSWKFDSSRQRATQHAKKP